jgi:hypothetical protein
MQFGSEMPLQLPVVVEGLFADGAIVDLIILRLLSGSFDGDSTLRDFRFLKASDPVEMGLSVVMLVKSYLSCEILFANVLARCR